MARQVEVEIKYGGGAYYMGFWRYGTVFRLRAKPGQTTYCHCGTIDNEEAMQRWFGDHGLRKRLAKRLLDAVIRGTGPLADPGHPRRLR